jgi:quercetin dioxygenase-like cupin family protein
VHRIVVACLLAARIARAEDADAAKAVEAVLVAAEPKLHRCWEKAAADDYRVEGQMSVRLVVGDGGVARSVEPRDDTTKKPALIACVRQAFAGSHVDGFAAGDAVEVPVVFRAEPNRTVRAADVTPWSGPRLLARVLVDGRSAAAEKASLVLFEVAPGGNAQLAPADATLVVVVADGKVTSSGKVLEVGDAILVPPRAPLGLVSATGAKVLGLYTPPGAEGRYRGMRVAAVKPAGKGRIYTAAAATTYQLAAKKGSVRMMVDGAPEAYAGWIELAAGAAVAEHVHQNEAEIIYVLAGAGEMTIDGQKYPVEPGMAVHVPPGAIHGFRVTSTMPVEAVQFYTPSGPEKRFKTP